MGRDLGRRFLRWLWCFLLLGGGLLISQACTRSISVPQKECASDADCTDLSTFCDTKGGRCVTLLCGQDSDCRSGWRCDTASERCVAPSAQTGCKADAACPSGQICRDTRCVSGCRDDQGCSASQQCLDNRCQEKTPTGCKSDADCKEAQKPRCVQGACQPDAPECEGDADCKDPTKPRCVDLRCVQPPPECESDADCKDPTRPRCVGGQCQQKPVGPEPPAAEPSTNDASAERPPEPAAPDPSQLPDEQNPPGPCNYSCQVDLVVGTDNCSGGPVSRRTGTGKRLVYEVNLAGCSALGVTVAICNPNGYVLNIGNSPSNNGGGGDAGSRTNDSELEIQNAFLAVFGNDLGPTGSAKVLLLEQNFVPKTGCVQRKFAISDGQLITVNPPLNLSSPYIFRLNQPDQEGPSDAILYVALNRVVSSSSRTGSGLEQITFSIR